MNSKKTENDTREQSFIELAKEALTRMLPAPLSSGDFIWVAGFLYGMLEFKLIDAREMHELFRWIHSTVEDE